MPFKLISCWSNKQYKNAKLTLQDSNLYVLENYSNGKIEHIATFFMMPLHVVEETIAKTFTKKQPAHVKAIRIVERNYEQTELHVEWDNGYTNAVSLRPGCSANELVSKLSVFVKDISSHITES